MADIEDLIERLRLIAAWHTRGGPMPSKPCPNKQKALSEAATTLSAQQREIAELREALKEAKKPRFNEPGYIPPPIPTHAFEPHPKLTGWCKHCGYPEGELLQHAALNTQIQTWQDHPRTAIAPFSADNSELEPDGQEQRSGSVDRQGCEGGKVGGRAALLPSGLQRGKRRLRSADGKEDVTSCARLSEDRAALNTPSQEGEKR